MSTTEASGETAGESPKVRTVDMRLEVVIIPVSDVDRAKRFYSDLGWRLDADIVRGARRIIQFTPPCSPCSIIFGKGVAPGCYLVVSDIEAARAEVADRGVEVGEVYHYAEGQGRVSGPDPARSSYASWASFSDPDGNGWLFQEITHRLPGRVDASGATFASSTELASALRRAEAAHGAHEKRIGAADPNWPDWYAAYMVAEQTGKPLPA